MNSGRDDPRGLARSGAHTTTAQSVPALQNWFDKVEGTDDLALQPMSKISSIVRSLFPAAFATTLAFAAIAPYPARTLAQTPSSAPSDATPQLGCLSGYPNGTYQGDLPVTRNEFAAALNACLNQVNQLIPINRADLATRADFEVLLLRQRELNEQLRGLSGRVGIPQK